MTFGVGIIGAGPGVGALHLPTLALLSDRFRVAHISDGGSGRAEGLARRVGARWSTGEHELLADPAVEVVLVCSPPAEHARQVLAAVEAGARTIVCEKPLALDTAGVESVIEACRAAGVRLLVGTNHLYDASWGRAKHHLLARDDRVETLTVTLSLPPNGRYHDVVAGLGGREAGPGGRAAGSAPDASPAAVRQRPRPNVDDPVIAAGILRQLVTGLAIHDLPVLRDLAPEFERVVYARLVPPIGYAVGYVASGILVNLVTVMLPDGADALWRMSIATSRDRIEIDFPPAFVHAGSASVRVRDGEGRLTEYARAPDDGYLDEWRSVASLLDGTAFVEYDEIRADALYAIAIADAAAGLLLAACGARAPESGVAGGVFRPRSPSAEAPGQLRDSAGETAEPRGSVVTLAGSAGWPARAREAVGQGASAIIVSEPEAPAALRDDAVRLAGCGVPIILDRGRLRPDLVADAVRGRGGETPRAIVVECAASREESGAVLRDALGWARSLAGGPLVSGSAHSTTGGCLAMFDGPGGVPVTLVQTVTAAGSGGGFIRISVLGETRTEVTVEIGAGIAEISTVTAAGVLRHAARFESPHRLALRRALAAATVTLPAAVSVPAPAPAPASVPADRVPTERAPAVASPVTDLADFLLDAAGAEQTHAMALRL